MCSTLFCTLLWSCFARLQRETSRNSLVTRFMEQMLNVLLFAIFSLPPWLIFISVAASISHFHTTAIKFPCNPSKVIGLLCFFISRSSSLSVFHVKADIRIKSKKRVGFVGVVVYLWNSGFRVALSALTPKGAGTWNAKFHPSLHERVDKRTDVRTIFWEPNFLTHGAPLQIKF